MGNLNPARGGRAVGGGGVGRAVREGMKAGRLMSLGCLIPRSLFLMICLLDLGLLGAVIGALFCGRGSKSVA